MARAATATVELSERAAQTMRHLSDDGLVQVEAFLRRLGEQPVAQREPFLKRIQSMADTYVVRATARLRMIVRLEGHDSWNHAMPDGAWVIVEDIVSDEFLRRHFSKPA